MDYPQVNIISTEQQYDEAKQDCIFFRRKSTEKNPVKDGDKYRAILVPSFGLPVAAMSDGTQADNVFQLAIRASFFDAAGEILRDFCDANKEAKEVSLGMFTFSTIVTKMQERVTSERLNGDIIGEWYDASETKKEASTRYGEDDAGKKKQAALRAHYLSLASNNPGITASLATKMIAYVSEKDSGSNVVKKIVEKLSVLSKKDTSDDL